MPHYDIEYNTPYGIRIIGVTADSIENAMKEAYRVLIIIDKNHGQGWYMMGVREDKKTR